MNLLRVEIDKLKDINSKIYNSEEKRKQQIDDLKKLDKELQYKYAIFEKLLSKSQEIQEN